MSAADHEALRRCDEFALAFDRDCADRIEPVEGGFAALTPSLPLVWAVNYVMFEQPGMEAERMAELCDRVLGAAGYEHREISVLDPAEGERLEPRFRSMGWEINRDVFLLLRSEPDRPAAADIAVRCEPLPAALRKALLREDDDLQKQPESLERLVEQLLQLEQRQSAVGGDRWYVADADGEPASATRLLARGGIGQIEDVATLASARNRGLARATVLAAVNASVAEGNELTFVIADADDWPLKLYERLGFESIGAFRSFRLRPGRRSRS
jgi:ribosomal protein S18 acetylase RimI-like enzyme